MWSEESIKQSLRNYLSRFFRNHSLQDDEDIFALGFVNSLLAMQIVNFVETTLAITIENEDLDLDNFRSINAITRLVQRKLSS